MTPDTLDIIAQIGVNIFGLAAMFLIARKNKWGFVVGLASQPFWITSFVINRQWGLVCIAVLFTINWIYGIYEWFFKKEIKQQKIRE